MSKLARDIPSSIEDLIKTRQKQPSIQAFELPADLAILVQYLAETMQVSPGDVVKKAILLLQVVAEANKRGYEVGVVKKADESKLEDRISLE